MDENYQSEWTKSIPLKEQKKIITRLMNDSRCRIDFSFRQRSYSRTRES